MERSVTEQKNVPIVCGKRKATGAIDEVGKKQPVSNNKTQKLLSTLMGYDEIGGQLPSNGSVSDGRTSAETIESSASERNCRESYTTLRPTPLVLTNGSDSEDEFDFDSPDVLPNLTSPWNTFKTNLIAIGVAESEIDHDLFSTFKEMGFVLASGESNEGVDLRDALSILKENSQTRQGRSGRGKRDTFTPTGSTSKTSGFATNADRKSINKAIRKLTK